MKKLTVLAALMGAAFAAQAQSSVTLYGVIDVAAQGIETLQANNTTVKSRTVNGSQGFSQSTWGLRVTEDMGDGLKAIANLESRIDASEGALAQTQMWQQSWVGLQSDSFGRITMGRQFNVLFDLVTTTYASHQTSPYFFGYLPELGMGLAVRSDNAIKYTAELGGLRVGLQTSAKESVSADPTRAHTVGGYARYAFGNFAVGAGMMNWKKDAFGIAALGEAEIKARTAGISYNADGLNLHAGYAVNTNGKTLADAAWATGLWGQGTVAGGAKRTMWTLGAGYNFTPAFRLSGALYGAKVGAHSGTVPNIVNGAVAAPPVLIANVADKKAKYMSLAASYAFSKRTDVYAEFDRTSGDVNTSGLTGISGGLPVVAIGGDLSPGAVTRRYSVGLRHRF